MRIANHWVWFKTKLIDLAKQYPGCCTNFVSRCSPALSPGLSASLLRVRGVGRVVLALTIPFLRFSGLFFLTLG